MAIRVQYKIVRHIHKKGSFNILIHSFHWLQSLEKVLIKSHQQFTYKIQYDYQKIQSFVFFANFDSKLGRIDSNYGKILFYEFVLEFNFASLSPEALQFSQKEIK